MSERTAWRCAFVGALTVAIGACSGDSPAALTAVPPADGALRVSVRVVGGEVDADGFTILVDGQPQPNVASNGTADVRGVHPGEHVVMLSGVAGHCTVIGAQQHTVTVGAGSVAAIVFEVSCLPTGIGVTARTSGVDGPSFYRVVVNDAAMAVIPGDGTLSPVRMTAGRYDVSLILQRENCSVDGGSDRTAAVSEGRLTPIDFTVRCSTRSRAPRIAFALDTTAWSLTARWVGIVNADGSGSRLIERGDHPSWSPDGDLLALSDATCDEEDVWIYGCTGGGVLVDPDALVEKRLGGLPALQIDWSPAGASMAATLCCAEGAAYVAVIDANGEQQRFLTGNRWTRVADPSWSPDGHMIAFTCLDWPLTYDVCTMASDGSRLTHLTSGLSDEKNPAWSPDGQRIAFTLNNTEIAILTVANRAVTRLTAGSDPSWSPDGRQLVFVGDNGLFMINADGTNRRRLTTGAHRSPAWRP